VLAEIQRSAENSLHATRQALMADFTWCLGSAQKIHVYQAMEINSKKSLHQGAVTRLWAVRGSILGRDNKIYILKLQNLLGDRPPPPLQHPIQLVKWAPSLQSKRQGHKPYHLPQYSAEVKNE